MAVCPGSWTSSLYLNMHLQLSYPVLFLEISSILITPNFHVQTSSWIQKYVFNDCFTPPFVCLLEISTCPRIKTLMSLTFPKCPLHSFPHFCLCQRYSSSCLCQISCFISHLICQEILLALLSNTFFIQQLLNTFLASTIICHLDSYNSLLTLLFSPLPLQSIINTVRVKRYIWSVLLPWPGLLVFFHFLKTPVQSHWLSSCFSNTSGILISGDLHFLHIYA